MLYSEGMVSDETRREDMSASNPIAVPLEGSEARCVALRVKREVAELGLAYARSVGDERLVAQELARLVQVAEWERAL